VIAVGRAGRGPEAELFARYAERLRPRPAVTEIADGRGSPLEIKRREGDALPPSALAIALDPAGEMLTSEALSDALTRWLGSARPVCFMVGGAEGLHPAVLTRADQVISLGRMTWPHLLARAMLAEQLYRAQCIAAGHPYHRGARPD
jgi:23S rRNA (pseudouridine1915-N3)-methyltransferase